MIYYKNGNWHISTEQVHYRQHGEEITQYVTSEGHDWWTDFESKWEHTELINFIAVDYTPDQLARFEEIEKLNVTEGFASELAQYVKDGSFPEGVNHPLRNLQLQKENEALQQSIAELSMLISMGGLS